MSKFMEVIYEAQKKKLEKEVHHKQVRDSRRNHLKELAQQVDYSMDRRRRPRKKYEVS